MVLRCLRLALCAALLAFSAAGMAAAQKWSGPYGALTFSLPSSSYSGRDLTGSGAPFPGDGKGTLDGSFAGGAIGFDFRRGDLVFGGEVSILGGTADGVEACSNTDFTCAAELKAPSALRARLGTLLTPDVLLYGSLGVAQAKAEFESFDTTTTPRTRVGGSSNTLTGYTIGVGLDYAVNNRVALRAAAHYYDFGSEVYTINVDALSGQVDLMTLDLSVLFRF